MTTSRATAPSIVKRHTFRGELADCFSRAGRFWQTTLEKLFPLGYQDASGFHFGANPPRRHRVLEKPTDQNLD